MEKHFIINGLHIRYERNTNGNDDGSDEEKIMFFINENMDMFEELEVDSSRYRGFRAGSFATKEQLDMFFTKLDQSNTLRSEELYLPVTVGANGGFRTRGKKTLLIRMDAPYMDMYCEQLEKFMQEEAASMRNVYRFRAGDVMKTYLLWGHSVVAFIFPNEEDRTEFINTKVIPMLQSLK